MIRILIADDHAIVRAGLKQFIADQPDMQVAGEASTGSEAIALVRAAEFDVVLLDISMPDKNGIDTLKTLKQIRPELPILMLSGYAEDQYAVNLLRAGAAGYLNKEAASTQLVGAIRTVVRGRTFVSPALAPISSVSIGRSNVLAMSRNPASSAMERRVSLVCGADFRKLATHAVSRARKSRATAQVRSMRQSGSAAG
jgi:DNA-binding NarL/FixJ family response regulator